MKKRKQSTKLLAGILVMSLLLTGNALTALSYEEAPQQRNLDISEDEKGSVPLQDTGEYVGSSQLTEIEIAKEIEGEWDKTFTFIVNQVTASSAPVEGPQDIRETVLGINLDYQVYDSGTDNHISDGNTGNIGEVRLQPGQYAKVSVPVGTLWAVTEKQESGYILTNLQGTEGNTAKLAGNLILLEATAPVTPVSLTVSTQLESVIAGEPLDKADYQVEVIYSDGSTRQLSGEEYQMNPETAPDRGGEFQIRFTWEDLTAILTMTANERTTVLTRDDVNNGVIDMETGELVVLNTGNVVIPERILRDGVAYTVTEIGNSAFGNNNDITGIQLPSTLTSIGRMAFFSCQGLAGSVVIPESVTTIDMLAFENCSDLTEIKLSEGLETIGGMAFAGCGGLTGDLVIPRTVVTIGTNAFSYCDGLTSITVLGKHEDEISGAPWSAPNAEIIWELDQAAP